MDILLTLLFVAIVYGAPKLWEKLWKDYQSKKDNSANLQGNGLPGNRATSFTTGQTTYAPSGNEYQLELKPEPITHVAVPLVASAPAIKEKKATWSGKMDANAVINGVIFAEIVQPPRAYRPFVRHK